MGLKALFFAGAGAIGRGMGATAGKAGLWKRGETYQTVQNSEGGVDEIGRKGRLSRGGQVAVGLGINESIQSGKGASRGSRKKR